MSHQCKDYHLFKKNYVPLLGSSPNIFAFFQVNSLIANIMGCFGAQVEDIISFLCFICS